MYLVCLGCSWAPSPACNPLFMPAGGSGPPCSPLVFDLSLAVDPGSLGEQGWKVLHVYGSPNPNDTALNAAGTITQVGPA